MEVALSFALQYACVMDILHLSFSERLSDFFVRYFSEKSAQQCTIIVHSHSMAHYVRKVLLHGLKDNTSRDVQSDSNTMVQIMALSDYLTLPHERIPYLYNSLMNVAGESMSVAQKCWHISQMLMLAEYCSADWLRCNYASSLGSEKYVYHIHKCLLDAMCERDAIATCLYKLCRKHILLIGSYPEYLLDMIAQWPVSSCTYLCRAENALMQSGTAQVVYYHDEEEQIVRVKHLLLHLMSRVPYVDTIGILAKKEETIERLRYHLAIDGILLKTLCRENFFHNKAGQTLRFFLNYCAETTLLNASIFLSCVHADAACEQGIWDFLGYAKTISMSLSLSEAYALYRLQTGTQCSEIEHLLRLTEILIREVKENDIHNAIQKAFLYEEIPQNVWRYLESFHLKSLYEYASLVENVFLAVEADEESSLDSRICVVGPLEGAWIECVVMLVLDASENVWAYKPSEWSACLSSVQRDRLSELMRTRLESALAHAFSAQETYLFCSASHTAICTYQPQLQEAPQGDVTMGYAAESVPSRANEMYPSAPYRMELPGRLYVSDLSLLNENPYAFYCRKILQLFPRKKAFCFGTFMHRLLFLCMGRSAKEYPMIIEKVLTELGAAAADLDLYRFKLSRLINAALSLTLGVSARGEVLGEAEIESSHGVFTLCARADCVIPYENTSSFGIVLDIIDYKTGVLPSISELMSGDSLQMGLEYYIAQKNGFGDCDGVQNMQFVHIHGRDCSARQGVSCINLPDPEKISQAAIERVKALLDEYHFSDFPAHPQKYYDAYAQLSREKETAL